MAADTQVQIDGYHIGARLDRGRGPESHRATDRAGRDVLLRLYAGEREDVKEARLAVLEKLAGIEDAHVVPVYDFGEVDGRVYVAMPFDRASTLDDLLQSRSRLPLRTAMTIFQQVAKGLTQTQAAGIVCRGLNPGDILVEGDGRSACLVTPGMPPTSGGFDESQAGTMHDARALRYMPPECLKEPEPGVAADTYALGAILYEMLTGEPPVGGFSLPSQRADVPPEVDPFVLRCLASDPQERYRDARAMLAALQRIALDVPELASLQRIPSVRPPALSGSGKRLAWLVPLALAAVIIAAVVVRGCMG